MENLKIEEIKNLPPEEAISILNNHINRYPEDEEAYTLRGRIYWSINRRREAVNDYLKALKINPDSRARILLEYANSIMEFYNKDLLNP